MRTPVPGQFHTAHTRFPSIADIERVHQMRLDDPSGYDAHLADARAAYPSFTSFEEWAKARRRSTKRDKSWNGVTAAKLATGRQ